MTQAVNLANFANNLDSSGGLNPLALNAATPISRGGTGVTTLGAAVALFGNALYPVGSLYFNATNGTNPATLLGFGTWVLYGQGQVPVGVSPGDPIFGSAGLTGGNRDAVVVSHSHDVSGTAVSAGNHNHTLQGANISTTSDIGILAGSNGLVGAYNRGVYGQVAGYVGTGGAHTHPVTGTALTRGTDGTYANLQPYVTVFIWQRTA